MNDEQQTKILIVEDENIVAKDIQNTLKSLGYLVAGIAASGEDAIQKAGETRPDLVLMDIMLRGYQDGVEAAQRIQAQYNIPVIYLTAYTDDKTLQRAKITEPYGYLLKPFEERELHIAIEMAIHKHRMAKKLQEREQLLTKILRTINDAVIVLDPKGEVVFMNAPAENMTGWKQKEAAGKTVAEIFKIVDGDSQTAATDGAVTAAGGERQSWLVAKDGRKIPIEDEAVPLRDEAGNLTGAILVFRDISARRQAQANEKRFRQMAENIREVFWMLDAKQATFIYVSPAYEEIWGRSCESLYQQPQSFLEVIHPEDRDRVIAAQAKQLAGELTHEEYRLRRVDGEERWIWDRRFPIKDKNGEVYRIVGIAEDITERKRTEEALRQSEEQLRKSQRLEAIGRLAGGLAHDFNNMLTAIIGTSELAMLELHRDHPVRRDLKEIKQTADRAAKLTRQLLAFARQQIIAPGILNMNDLLLNLDKMLRRLIGEDIELVIAPASDIGLVKVDAGQIEQVVVNLAVNARDAMPQGGKLILQTENVTVDQKTSSLPAELPPGDYVLLTVRDTGLGMSKEAQSHLFEPFFTTKEVGKGIGLGLATCYGIIKQNGGHIEVESVVDEGSTFRIYLPRLDKMAEAMPEQERAGVLPPGGRPSGNETVLLVEDEPTVREVATRILREQGYNVLVAANGDEALNLVRSRPSEPLHLLVTDVVMPRMSGRVVADQLRATRPEMKVLFISGYSDDTLTRHGASPDTNLNFLQKPFSPSLLAYKIREVLDKIGG
jgi:PAS domain S-box-containing protein